MSSSFLEHDSGGLCTRLTNCRSRQALRVSMEEQRQRQEEEARRAAAASAAEAGVPTPSADGESRTIHETPQRKF